MTGNCPMLQCSATATVSQFDNSDGKYDKYFYLSAEKKYGGKGPFAEGLKFFAWTQRGSRAAG